MEFSLQAAPCPSRLKPELRTEEDSRFHGRDARTTNFVPQENLEADTQSEAEVPLIGLGPSHSHEASQGSNGPVRWV